MNRTAFTAGVSELLRRVLFISILAGSLVEMVHAQEISIRVLNGHNGRPVTKECVNVWTGTGHGEHIVAATNKRGVAELRLVGNEILAESACPGWPSRASRSPGLDAITISGDYYVACQEYAKIVAGEPPINPFATMPSYPIKKILESGITTGNTCGKFKVEAEPGELIFFVRPRSFLERLRE